MQIKSGGAGHSRAAAFWLALEKKICNRTKWLGYLFCM
jgi:hypothetical protein